MPPNDPLAPDLSAPAPPSDDIVRLAARAAVQAGASLVITETGPPGAPGSRIVFVNEAFTRRTGYTAAEVVGRSPGFLQASATRPEEVLRIAEALARGEAATTEVVHLNRDGSTRHGLLRLSPLLEEARGGHTRYVMLEHDILERAPTADELRVAKEGLEQIVFESTADLRTANARLSQEVNERRRAEAALEQARAELETRVRERTEELRIANERLAGELAERRRAEAARSASEARYRQLFENAGEAIYILQADGDAAGAILEANTAAAAMHGYTVAELQGMSQLDLDAPEVADGTPGTIRRIGHGEWIEGETLHVKKDGTRFAVEFAAGPLDAGGQRFIIKFARDITERKRAEEALRQAKKIADVASRAKSAFLANMSHEIRTPMNAILGYTQLLERSPELSSEQRRHLEVIKRSGEHLLDLINDVLEMSKVEAGYRKHNRALVDLGRLLDDLGRAFRVRASAKRLAFAIDRPPELPAHIVTDGSKLRQALVNLVGNAVKFTEQGSVAVRARVRCGEGTAVWLQVEVEDTGPGIAREHLDELFRPFAQASVGIHARGGTGLGLALSREFARLLGGDLTVESHLGQGSVFRLEIPIEISVAPVEARPVPQGRVMAVKGMSRRVRVLVIDEDKDSRGWLRQLLEQVGFDVRDSINGADALATFDGWRPHLVLMDMHMSVVDGALAVRAIRARPAGRRAAIVAITSSTFEEEHDGILEAGADGVLRKPCREGDLLDEIQKQLGIEYDYAEAPPPERISEVPDLAAMRLDHVSKLPTALVTELRTAARVADYDRLKDLLAQIPREHEAVAEALRELLEQYGYEQIEAMLGG